MEFLNNNKPVVKKEGTSSTIFNDEDVNCLIEYLSSGDDLSAYGKYQLMPSNLPSLLI